jgi:hypothetical membrane protein
MSAVQRWRPAFGVLAAAQMIVFVTIAEAIRPGYHATRNWISQLSLGPGGSLAALNLATCGLWVMLAGLGLRPRVTRRTAGFVLGCGACLVLLALVRTDAGIGYPPGVPATHTAHGWIHQLISVALGVAGIGAAAGLGEALPFRRARTVGRAVAGLMAASFVTGSVLVLLDAGGVWPDNPSGLFERVAMFAGLGWIGVVSGWAARDSSGPGPGAGSSTDRPGPGRTSGAGTETARTPGGR